VEPVAAGVRAAGRHDRIIGYLQWGIKLWQSLILVSLLLFTPGANLAVSGQVERQTLAQIT
jgi:hypothetical protein